MAEGHWLAALGLSLGVQWLAWPLACFFRTEKFYDLTGSLTFLLVSHLSYSWSSRSLRHTIASYTVLAWACRLGTFLATRVIKDGGDKRFEKVKHEPARFLVWWTVQGVWVFVTLLPTILLNSSRRAPALGPRDWLGGALWAAGFVIEVVADLQKSMFRADPANSGRFIQSGLWSLSRHPNYLGEILLWFGQYLACSSVFRGWEHLSVASPVMVMLLITRVSGIPILEASGLARWGGEAEYQRYLREVPSLVPFLRF